MNFWVSYPLLLKIWRIFQILIEITVNLKISVENIAILTMLNFLINEHGMFFSLFLCLISFKVFQHIISGYKFCTHYPDNSDGKESFVKFISKYCIPFDIIKNGIVFLISFSDCSLEVYRKRTDFFILIIHPSIFPNSFILIDF